jgi:uncharacterized protein
MASPLQTSPFNILQESPHDKNPVESDLPVAQAIRARWAPSRYTIRATTSDGRLILWNTFTGAMSVFPADQVPTLNKILRKPGIEAEREGLVAYLADKGFLIKEDVNEYRRVQYEIGSQHYRTDILQFILLASEDCNFRCTYCYENFARGTMQPWVRSAIKKLVERRLPSLNQLRVSWFGGEPLYGFEAIKDLGPFFVEMAQKASIPYSSDMTTNAYLLTPAVADQLLAWKVLSYQITIDGPPEFHDCTRPTRDGQGTFSTIFENIQALHRRSDRFHVALRVNFDRNNYPHLGGFLDLLEQELRDDNRFEVRFRAVGRWGGPNDEALDICGEDSPRIQRDLEEEARRRGLNVGEGLKGINRIGSEVCYAARPYNFIIGASGKLMKCTVLLDMKDYNVVGKITEDGNLELDRDKMALWTEPAFESDSKCRKCVVLPLCQGTHCPLIRIEDGQSPCTSVRLNAKRELVMTQEMRKGKAKRIHLQSAS